MSAAQPCRVFKASRVFVVLTAFVLGSLPAQAQSDSPLTPAPPRQVHRITSENTPDPAPIPPEQIIQAVVAREAECLRAHERYGFKRSVRLQEFLPGGEPGGEILQESVVYLAEDGKRYEKVSDTSKKNFVATNVAEEDLKTVSRIPLFPIVPDQAQYYIFTYKGSQPLDELHTYIFEVKPKRLLPNYSLFHGLLYIDDRDLAIVQMYGRWDAQAGEESADTDLRRIPFTMYEIYFENVEGKMWFPTYIRSDAYLHGKAGDDQVRLVVKMTDFKAVPAAPAPAAHPAAVPAPPKPANRPPSPPPAA